MRHSRCFVIGYTGFKRVRFSVNYNFAGKDTNFLQNSKEKGWNFRKNIERFWKSGLTCCSQKQQSLLKEIALKSDIYLVEGGMLVCWRRTLSKLNKTAILAQGSLAIIHILLCLRFAIQQFLFQIQRNLGSEWSTETWIMRMKWTLKLCPTFWGHFNHSPFLQKFFLLQNLSLLQHLLIIRSLGGADRVQKWQIFPELERN